jgi:hypothetical protein
VKGGLWISICWNDMTFLVADGNDKQRSACNAMAGGQDALKKLLRGFKSGVPMVMLHKQIEIMP